MDVESVGSEGRQAGRPATHSQSTPTAAELRNVGNEESSDAVLQTEDVRQEWLTVYRFPHIVAVRVFCRFKIYQTVLTVVFSVMYALSHVSHASAASSGLLYATGVSLFTTMALYVVGNILRRVVGFIYLSPDETRVKIAHIDFWGKRRDHEVDVKYIVPLYDSAEFLRFRQLFISDPQFTDKYYLLSMKGVMPKPQVFADTFGIHVPGAEIMEPENREKDE